MRKAAKCIDAVQEAGANNKQKEREKMSKLISNVEALRKAETVRAKIKRYETGFRRKYPLFNKVYRRRKGRSMNARPVITGIK